MPTHFKHKGFRRFLWMTLILFVIMNVVAFFHAWKFTHFSDSGIMRTKQPAQLSLTEKITALFFGVSLPRQVNTMLPDVPFETITLQSNKQIACWMLQSENSKGTVILFHGFAGEKSSMLDKAKFFLSLGYNCMLVDFMGSGNSEGNQTTVGYFEAQEVTTCYEYLKKRGEENVYLFGTSMGAVAIMKALYDDSLQPEAIMIECPFGTMYKTTCVRFHSMKVPAFPMAGLLVFWGGVQNGFWAFDHNPEEYAERIKCPVLLMSGGKDEKVSLEEIDIIYNNLKGNKTLKIFPGAGHENYLKRFKAEWEREVEHFMTAVPEY